MRKSITDIPPRPTPEEIAAYRELSERNIQHFNNRDWFEDPYLNELYYKFMGSLSPIRTFCQSFLALHSREFIYSVELDENRYIDGLKYRKKMDPRRTGPCTVLEMMCALADRMEVEQLQDPDYGDRTDYWFQCMFESLGLFQFDDENFNEVKVNRIIDRFLRREYNKTGKGGLFTFYKSVPGDPRNAEIWYQMNWWVSENY